MSSFREFLNEKKIKIASKQEIELKVNDQYENKTVYTKCTVWNEDDINFIIYKGKKIIVTPNKNDDGIDWFGTVARY